MTTLLEEIISLRDTLAPLVLDSTVDDWCSVELSAQIGNVLGRATDVDVNTAGAEETVALACEIIVQIGALADKGWYGRLDAADLKPLEEAVSRLAERRRGRTDILCGALKACVLTYRPEVDERLLKLVESEIVRGVSLQPTDTVALSALQLVLHNTIAFVTAVDPGYLEDYHQRLQSAESLILRPVAKLFAKQPHPDVRAFAARLLYDVLTRTSNGPMRNAMAHDMAEALRTARTMAEITPSVGLEVFPVIGLAHTCELGNGCVEMLGNWWRAHYGNQLAAHTTKKGVIEEFSVDGLEIRRAIECVGECVLRCTRVATSWAAEAILAQGGLPLTLSLIGCYASLPPIHGSVGSALGETLYRLYSCEYFADEHRAELLAAVAASEKVVALWLRAALEDEDDISRSRRALCYVFEDGDYVI